MSDTDGPNKGKGTRRDALIVAAVLIPLIPIIVAIVLISSGGSSSPAKAPATVAQSPVSSTPASTHTTVVNASPKLVPARKPKPRVLAGSIVAHVIKPTELYSSPGGAVIAAQPLKTPFGSNAVLLVRRSEGSWLGVASPLVGNNKIGWISRAAVRLGRVNYRLSVSLAARELTVTRGDTVLERYRVAIGKPSTPTPTGTFAVTDRIQTDEPSSAYGCCILALSAVAPHAIQDWSGGDRIAVHSTLDSSTIGDAVSHGCMHVTLAEGEWLLEHVPLGTPITIRSD
jgi:lipoprotein-anchoring transpeptidase ErfK/SrfK